MADQLRAFARAAARVGGMALAIIVVSVAGEGWFYLARARVHGVGGPRIADALPLDELPGHASMPLLIFLLIAIVTAAVLGCIARLAGLDRLSAALVLATGVGVVLYLADAVSIYVVRQVSLSASFTTASSLRSLYVLATIAGLAGAFLGRRSARGQWMTSFIVYIVSVAGILDLLSAVLPPEGVGLGRIAPNLLPPIAAALVVPAGVLLLISARGLARSNRAAWRVALVVSGASALLNVIRGPRLLNVAIAVFIVLSLLARRHDFSQRSDPSKRVAALGRLVSVIVFAFVYALVVLVVNRVRANLNVELDRASLEALRALVGIGPRRGARIGADFAEWYPWSVVSIVAIGIGWAAATWSGPWRHRPSEDDGARALAEEVVRRFGSDTLAPFALRADKDIFVYGAPNGVAADTSVVMAYRVVRGVAILTGDPIGPLDQLDAALTSFLSHAADHGWHVAILGASEKNLDRYRAHGLRAIYHGNEALIDIESFSLDGPPMRVVRQAVHRIERKGYVAEIVSANELDAHRQAELAEVDDEWLKGQPRRGFSMQLDALFRQRDDVFFVVGRSASGQVDGFLHVCVCEASRTLSLSSMPRRLESPNGLNAFLVYATVLFAMAHDYTTLSLNFAPFAELLDPQAELQGRKRAARAVLLRTKRLLSLQLDNLLLFNRRFCPRWERRYVVYDRRRNLPRIVLAGLAAEGHLPFAERVRGWGRCQGPDALDSSVPVGVGLP